MERVKSTGSFGFLLTEIALALCIMTLVMGSFVSLYVPIVQRVHDECAAIRAFWKAHRQLLLVQREIERKGFAEQSGHFNHEDGFVVARRDRLYPSYVHLEARTRTGKLVLYKGYLL